MIFLRLLTLTLRDIILFSQGRHNRHDRPFLLFPVMKGAVFMKSISQVARPLLRRKSQNSRGLRQLMAN